MKSGNKNLSFFNHTEVHCLPEIFFPLRPPLHSFEFITLLCDTIVIGPRCPLSYIISLPFYPCALLSIISSYSNAFNVAYIF